MLWPSLSCCISCWKIIVRTLRLALWRLLTFFSGYFQVFNFPYFFLDEVEKCNCYLFVSISAFKNISGILSVLSLFPSILLLPFSRISIKKCINHIYLVDIYTPNTRSTPYFFLCNRQTLNFYLPYSSFSLQYITRIFLLSSKLLNMLGGSLLFVCLLLNTLFLLFFLLSAVIGSAAPILF